jgi:hypothetical protein
LRRAVAELLDGCGPRAVRIVGAGAPVVHAGAHRIARDGRSDAELEAALAKDLGKIAIATDGEALEDALLEARMYGCMAVSLAVPTARPVRWPRDAGLVFVLYGAPHAWVADLPTLPLPAAAVAADADAATAS